MTWPPIRKYKLNFELSKREEKKKIINISRGRSVSSSLTYIHSRRWPGSASWYRVTFSGWAALTTVAPELWGQTDVSLPGSCDRNALHSPYGLCDTWRTHCTLWMWQKPCEWTLMWCYADRTGSCLWPIERHIYTHTKYIYIYLSDKCFTFSLISYLSMTESLQASSHGGFSLQGVMAPWFVHCERRTVNIIYMNVGSHSCSFRFIKMGCFFSNALKINKHIQKLSHK